MLITEEYRSLLLRMHKKQKNFGMGSKKRKEYIQSLGFTDILDYGCGKGKLGIGRKYDPAIPDFSQDPEPADLIVCTDVLEHIEPDLLNNVLDHMKSKMKKQGFLTISCSKAAKKLPDGRNAHLIIQTPDWWVDKLREHFIILMYSVHKDPLKKKESIELEVHVKPS